MNVVTRKAVACSLELRRIGASCQHGRNESVETDDVEIERIIGKPREKRHVCLWVGCDHKRIRRFIQSLYRRRCRERPRRMPPLPFKKTYGGGLRRAPGSLRRKCDFKKRVGTRVAGVFKFEAVRDVG